jgi:hypothetical protein
MVNLVDELRERAGSGDAYGSLETLEKIEIEIRSNPELLKEVLSPPVLTELHNLLVEKLNVNRKHMQIRKRVTQPKTRGMLFVKAMIVGVKHCESMVQKG